MRRTSAVMIGTGAAVGLAMSGVASAGTHGATSRAATATSVAPWSTVTGPVPAITQPDTLRVGDRLQVIWSQSDGSTSSVRVRPLDSRARPVGPVATVVEGWLAVVEDPKLFVSGTDQVAAFAGIRSFAPGDPYVGPMVSARSSDGSSWALAPGSLTESAAAGNSGNIDAIDAGGEPFVAFSGFTPALVLHRGFRTGSPADTGDFTAAAGGSYYAALARDTATGEVWAAWHSPNGEASQVGTRVQRVWPRSAGPALTAPGSVTGSVNSTGPGQPVALAARAGGGIWVAYLPGYPTSSTIRLWQAGSGSWLDVPAGGSADLVTLSASGGGRLWLSWHTLGDRVLHATRSNPAVSRWGAVRTVPQPGGPTSQLRATTTDAARGPLDIVSSAQVGGAAEPSLYSLQVLPGLQVVAKPRKLDRGTVRIRVSDAGSPVARAKVSFRGSTVRTNGHGRAAVKVSAKLKSGRFPAVVRKAGYATTRIKVRVT